MSETKTRNATEQYYRWEDRIGHPGPYACLDVISFPGKGLGEINPAAYAAACQEACERARAYGVQLCTCYVCGNCLTHNAVWQAADGYRFVSGLDCAGRAGVQTSAAEEMQRREMRRRERAVELAVAELRAQQWRDFMAVNGWDGLVTVDELRDTTYRIIRRREQERVAREAAAAGEQNAWLIDALREAYPGDFVLSMIDKLNRQLINRQNFTERMMLAMSDIYAKASTGRARRGTKRFNEAVKEFADRAGMYTEWNESFKYWHIEWMEG